MTLLRSRFLWIVIGVIIVVTTAPYVYAYATRPAGGLYAGIHNLTSGDTSVYYSMIQQVKDGHELFVNLYTPENQSRIQFNALWLVTGLLARWLDLSPVLAYHLMRIALIPPLVFLLYRIIRYVIPASKELQRKVTLVVLLFSSGIGIIVEAAMQHSELSIPDMWVAEFVTFLTMYHSPHFIASLLFLLASIWYGFRAFSEQRTRYAVYAGVNALVLFHMHPFYIPTVYSILGVWLLVLLLLRSRALLRSLALYGLIILISLPAIGYYVWLLRTSAIFKYWEHQNILLSPPFWMYLVGLGIVVPFACWGAIRTFHSERYRFLTLWLVTQCALLYVPLDFQRRLSEGLQVPFVILGVEGFFLMLYALRHKPWQLRFAICVFACVFLPLSNLHIVTQDILSFRETKTYPYYIPADDTVVFRWVKEHTGDDALVLTAEREGNYLPALTGRRAFIGHGIQTINFDNKNELVRAFFSARTTDEWRMNFLRSWGVDYVWYNPQEFNFAVFSASVKTYLRKELSSGGITLFSVALPGAEELRRPQE